MNYIFTISGFTQNRYSRYGSGSIGIYSAMRKHAGADTTVRLLRWKDDPVGHAREVAQNIGDGKVQVNAYSYGGGWWFLQFAKELEKRGVDIEMAVLCDPVYRYPWYLKFMQWRTFIGSPNTIKIPLNVKKFAYFYQKVDTPRASELVWDSDNTEKVSEELLDVGHCKMDNHASYLQAAEEHANKLFGG